MLYFSTMQTGNFIKLEKYSVKNTKKFRNKFKVSCQQVNSSLASASFYRVKFSCSRSTHKSFYVGAFLPPGSIERSANE
jgi:hypothetical protein